MPSRPKLSAVACVWAACWLSVSASAAQTATLVIRGQPQTLHLYGDPQHDPIVVSSGDGGWLHLAPQVAVALADAGYFVVGFDSKAYLESFTTDTTALTAPEEPADFAALVDYASRGSHKRPILVGVSEGAALSVLAATDYQVRQRIDGVIALGLGDLNELGWRWRDAVIYLTHKVPHEPTFSVRAVVSRVAPLPLAVINSLRDEYVPVLEVQDIVDAASEPKKLWLIDAADHRFSNRQAELNERLLEAIAWARRRPPRSTAP